MNINRHNYEEFFLLFVDNELSAKERNAVELFVQENPDLKIELDLLKQTIAEADNVGLHKKDWLYMVENISELQENLLLYADDELNAADRKFVDHLLSTDKKAEAEWLILKQTKVQPDMSVVFEDKQSLYRHAGARIISMKWWKLAAAAVILGFTIWSAVSVYKNNSAATENQGSLVKKLNTAPALAPDKTLPEKTAPGIDQPETKESHRNVGITAVTPDKTGELKIVKTHPAEISASDKTNEQKPVRTKIEAIAVQKTEIKKPGNDLPKPYFENINNNRSNETVAKNVIPENNNIKISGKNTEVVKSIPNENINNRTAAGLNNNTNAPATALLVTNNKTADENINRYLELEYDDDKEKRTGLGGLLRKAKRMIERTTNINTGEGVKIAGFEIALK